MIIIVMMVMMMLVRMLFTELATAFITSMTPYVMVVPMAGEPDELVAIVPIAPTFVKPPIPNLNREPDRVGALLENHASGQNSHCKNCKFLFHSTGYSYASGSLVASGAIKRAQLAMLAPSG